jgi:hypothetical protein
VDYGAEFQTLKQDTIGHNDSENRLARGHEFVQDFHLHAQPLLEHLLPALEAAKAQLQTQGALVETSTHLDVADADMTHRLPWVKFRIAAGERTSSWLRVEVEHVSGGVRVFASADGANETDVTATFAATSVSEDSVKELIRFAMTEAAS